MANELIHVLANHPGPFLDLKLPYNPNFQPLILPPEQAALHAALRLDERRTDYYLAAYAAALQAFPDIAAYLNIDSTCDMSRVYVPPLRLVGARIPHGSEATAFKPHAGDPAPLGGAWPLNLRFQLQYLSADLVQFTARDSGSSTTLGYTLGGSAPEQYLRVNWTVNEPFDFELILETAWGPDSVIDLLVWPPQFPFAAAIQSALPLPGLMHTLESIEVLPEFHVTADPCEKTAILLLAMLAWREGRFLGIHQ